MHITCIVHLPLPHPPPPSLPPFLILSLSLSSLPRTLTSQMVVVFQKRKKMNLQQPIMSRRKASLVVSRRRASPVVSRRRASPANPVISERFISRRRTWRMDLDSHLSRSRQQTSCWQTSRMQWMRCCRSSR